MDEKLILYLRDYCGYCAMVQDVISELAVEVEERNIWDNDTWQGMNHQSQFRCLAVGTGNGDGSLIESDYATPGATLSRPCPPQWMRSTQVP